MLFEPFLSFDSAVFQSISGVFGPPGANAAQHWFFNFVTMLGNSGWFWIALAVGFLIFKKTRKLGLIMAFALILELLLVNIIMKPAFARPRPYDLEIDWWRQAYLAVFPEGLPLADHLPTDMSFPSGHAAVSFAGALAWCFGSRRAWVGRARWVSYIGIVTAALIAFSRLYLGVHYATDVLAGVLAGALCALLAALIFRVLQPHIFRPKRIKMTES
ncbi:MAG: phosphatase PAP2 family protein [Oscillospiraceae bacterium]|jgi:undecaprenyl-diphosphatase|nr:phosphatase PAP2 family protein [Oscillospiraceae bacterium]